MRHLASSSKPAMMARLPLLIWSQRKLFLLVFLWTSLCLLILKTTRQTDQLEANLPSGGHHHQQARSAASLRPAAVATSEQALFALEILAPEFDLPTRPIVGGSDRRHHYELLEDNKVSQVGIEIKAKPSTTYTETSSTTLKTTPRHLKPASEKMAPPKSAAPSTTTTTRTANTATNRDSIPGDQCHYDYPNLFDLQFNNIHWQKYTSNARELNLTQANLKAATFYLYNAYYDDRWRAGQPSVRVLAMVDRIHPPPVNCLLWSTRLNQRGELEPDVDPSSSSSSRQFAPSDRRPTRPLVTRAQFVYAWYPKWGNYDDGLLQPWIVTCPIPRDYAGLVPDSVSLVDVPQETIDDLPEEEPPAAGERDKRDLSESAELASMPMPPSYSSSSSSSPPRPPPPPPPSDPQLSMQSPASHSTASSGGGSSSGATSASVEQPQLQTSRRYDCQTIEQPITNNLPVFNRRPQAGAKREKFAVCVKGLDFPQDNEHVSIRLVEWIELLNLLGAKKIFLYNLNVHENISKVLHYYQKRGLVELSPLTLPGDQPNLPEYQHLYLKQKLTSKRQNELLPYNDCLYRNLYSYQYLALLDIDEIIMPLRGEHTNWYDLMNEVERVSLAEQNYSRASYNVRNVYFFDDLSGPLGTTQPSQLAATSAQLSMTAAGIHQIPQNDRTEGELASIGGQPSYQNHNNHRHHHDSAERGIPHYLHMMSHVYRSKNYTEPGQYVKCFHNTERVISLHNHFPMNCFGQCTTYSIPVDLAHLQHYRKDCVGPLKQSCKNDFRLFTTRDTTIWKYKQRMIKRTTRALNHLGLLATYNNNNHNPGQPRQQQVPPV